MRIRLSFLWIFVLDANMGAMAHSLSAIERACSLAQSCPRCPRGGEIVECRLNSQNA
jgi:hypothetical protein